MRSRKLIYFIVLLFHISNVLATFEFMQWDNMRVDIKRGDSFNITCRASLRNYLDVVRIHVAYDHGTNHTISDGRNVKEIFARMERLDVKQWIENQNVLHTTLLFNNARGEDAGSYSCFRLGDPNKNVAEVHVHVHVPIKSVTWSNDISTPSSLSTLSTSPPDDMVTLKMKETEDSRVTCVVTVEGTVDAPLVRVLMDGVEDVTSYFVESQGPRITTGKDGLERLTSVTQLTHSTLYPLPFHQGHNLTCLAEVGKNGPTNASVDVGSFGSMATTAVLHIEFVPILICQKYQYHVYLHGNVSVSCLLFSNPQSNLNWSMSGSKVVPGSPSRVELVQKKVGHNKFQVTFTISELEESQMGEYRISATNDISFQEVTIILTQIQPSNEKANIFAQSFIRFDALTGSTSSPHSILSTILLLIISIFFCILLH